MRTPMRTTLTLILALALAGCGGDDPADPSGGNTGGDGLSCKVDGVSWTAPLTAAHLISGVVSIAGTDASSSLGVGLGFLNGGTGTYAVGPGSPITACAVTEGLNDAWSASGDQGSGTITVTTLSSTRVAGTFSFTAPRSNGAGDPATRTVTEGTFNLPITTFDPNP